MSAHPPTSPENKMEAISTKSKRSPFLSKTYQVSLQDVQVLQCSTAYDDTFVVLVYKQSTEQTIIMHFDRNSALINTYQDCSNETTFEMLRSDEVIFLDSDNQVIVVINLRSGEIKNMLKWNRNDYYVRDSFIAFPETQLICLVEESCSEPNLQYQYGLRLRYYQYGGYHSESRLIYEISPKYKQHMIHKCRKIDNSSKVCWVLMNQKNQMTAIILELNKNNVGQMQAIDLQVQNDLTTRSLLWQLQNKTFLELYQNWINRQLGAYSLTNFAENLANFIVISKDQERIAFMKYNSSAKIQNYIIFCTFIASIINIQKQGYVMTIIDSKTGQFVSEEQYKVDSKTKMQYFSVGWDSALFCEQKYINEADKTSLQMKITDTSKPIKDVYMYMLEHINEDFDEDLLQDCVELLTE